VSDAITRSNKLLQETTSEEADDIRARLATIRNHADYVLRLSADRLAGLEDALPVATHFAATHSDLRAWLDEIAAEILSIDVPHPASSEQIRKVLEAAKVQTVRPLSACSSSPLRSIAVKATCFSLAVNRISQKLLIKSVYETSWNGWI